MKELSQTVDEARLEAAPPTAVAPTPEFIGRYRVERLLGKGGFGLVYLTYDDQLRRLVAIKVPHNRLVARAADAEVYLNEARTVAGLDHSSIVPVYDVGSTDQFPCFVVSKYIDGSDLATTIKQSRLSRRQAVELVATVADALHYAHKLGLVHRDIKPGNILLDQTGKAFVADFGLTLREQDVGKGPCHVGTPAYMSPEQARGEGHRVDGRSDIFSLGVVLYELLVGRRPFKGDSEHELLEQITGIEARPPRQVDDTIDKELDRICLKALSKRASERYSAARDMADDLRHFLEAMPSTGTLAAPSHVRNETDVATPVPTPTTPPSLNSQPVKIVPKGLRSFDAHDADFFLELLPGPRDRDGLPDSLRFWKAHIEGTDADDIFSVGLIYGPSGCGKSSLVKAGLLPRLSTNVIAVYVEATADDTETRLLNGLRKRCPFLPDNLGLKGTLTALRRGQGVPACKKVLIVLDQFEQWLHARKEERNTELVQALRQCDGGRVQCIVMVRDDFWMAATRFMCELEVRLLEGQNSAAVDLFNRDHARRVLAALGRAFGKLPENPAEMTAEEKQFLQLAVLGLSEEDKVVSVRLALFAEMMKGKAWTPAALKAVGGTAGVGVTFLEETFSAASARPEYRYHQKAARSVLAALLPESGADIKGHMQSYAELLEASGYGSRTNDFNNLVRILDSDTRLITPTDPEGVEGGEWRVEGGGAREEGGNQHDHTELQRTGGVAVQHAPSTRYFQLTHDFLVPALRDWLTRKQKETRRGRAELLLADRAVVWNTRQENRQLPSLVQWLQIRWLTAKQNWTPLQKKMMNRAGRVIALRTGLAGLVGMLAAFTGLFIADRVEQRQKANYAKALVESLSVANTPDVENLVAEIGAYQQWAVPLLQNLVAAEASSPKEKLHASLALVQRDASQVDFLFEQLLHAEAADVPVIVRFLQPHAVRLEQPIRATLEQGSLSERIRAAAALAAFDSQHEQWQQARSDVVTALVSVPPSESGDWIKMLRPVGALLAEPLKQRFHDRNAARDAERPIAAAALADYLKDNLQSLVELMLLADHEQEFQPLVEAVRRHKQEVVNGMQNLLRGSPKNDDNPAVRDSLLKVHANAAVCLLEMGETESVWPLFRDEPDPSLRSFVIDRIARLGGNHEVLAARIKQEQDPASRYALILALGRFDVGKLSGQQRQAYLDQLEALYRDDPESGVHGAAEWVLSNWRSERVAVPGNSDGASPPPQGRNWFVNSQRQTFAVIKGPVRFLMNDTRRRTAPHAVTVSYDFAVATHEVTVEQFLRFRGDQTVDPSVAPSHDCPMTIMSWYDAAAYCNWLSEREGIPPDQRCYEPNDKQEYAEGMKIAADYLQRTGYRLPTEAEWECACRAGTASTFAFGEPEELVRNYAWHMTNSESRLWPVGAKMPNGWGLFDMHGNAWEWCQNLWGAAPIGPSDATVMNSDTRVLRGGAFSLTAQTVKSACRFERPPTANHYDYGFRVVRTLPPVAEEPLPQN